MSTIHIHVGQCGNQLSIPLWKNYIKYDESSQNRLFTSIDKKHRSIHIDSESKVVSAIPKNYKIREKNVIVGKRGRGNNFALGYHGVRTYGDENLLEDCLEAVRHEIERCDMYTGAIMYHSLGGGTGSGLGAHITELLRDFYPCGHIMSCAVLPCASGESPLQSLNSLLALYYLQLYTDAVILLHNDFYISYLSNKIKSSDEKTDQVSYKNINQTIANILTGAFLPTNTLSGKKGFSTGQEPWELMRNVAPFPSSKFITLSQYVSAKLSWEGIASKMLQSFPRYTSSGCPNSCLAAAVIGRGDHENMFMSAMQTSVEKKMRKSLNFVRWNPYPLDFWWARDNHVGPQSSSSLTLAANSSLVQEQLHHIHSRSLLKLESGAYLHWYHRHGISKELFNESAETVQGICDSYSDLTKS